MRGEGPRFDLGVPESLRVRAGVRGNVGIGLPARVLKHGRERVRLSAMTATGNVRQTRRH
jgi:hypothetical protein